MHSRPPEHILTPLSRTSSQERSSACVEEEPEDVEDNALPADDVPIASPERDGELRRDSLF